MAGWTLFFLQLLPLTVCFDNEVTLEKTLSGEPDDTALCFNVKVDFITLIVCKISTERSSGEMCPLVYRRGHDFENNCDSRFTLMTENQTVFLHLTSLTPEDSGNHTCECSHADGTFIQHFNITVEARTVPDVGASPDKPGLLILLLAAVTTAIVITAIILGFIHVIHKRLCSLSGNETPGSMDQGKPEDPYTSLQFPASDIYQTIPSIHCRSDNSDTRLVNKVVTGDSQGVDMHEQDTGSVSEAYDNVET